MAGPYDATRAELAAAMPGEPRYRVDQAWRALYVERATFDEATALPARLRARLAEAFPPALAVAAERVTDGGATRKWLFELDGGATVETVLMAYEDRVTVCVSSQAGCAMGCTFCATGQAGFARQLRLGEVLEQVARAARAAAPRRLTNVVFMGMGEPLANYAVTVAALRRLRDDVGLSARHLTVSTVGVAPAIERLAGEGLPVTLALSLHAATDDKRMTLVPLNARYPIERLMAALEEWIDVTGRRVSFEWALIDGVNDGDDDAVALAALARRVGAHVNLIPLNPTPGYLVRGSAPARVREFRDRLEGAGVAASVRATRGRSIDAACGQLAAVARARRVSLRR